MNPSDNDNNVKNRNLENSEDLKPAKKKNKGLKVFMIIAIVIITVLIIAAVTMAVMIYRGRNAALNGNKEVKVDVPSSFSVESTSDANGSYVYHDGKKYQYNDKITTVLFAGIDKRTEQHDVNVFGTAGKADCIFVMALDTESGEYKLMAVSRDSMVDVDVIGSKDIFHGTEKMQICLAYAYGDGKQKSADNLKRSVSRLFFGIPINSYIAFDLDVIPILNNQVGGVKVTVNEDLSRYDPTLYEGAEVTLNDTQAEIFVRRRDIYADANQNNLRMERQKVFLTSFLKQTLALTKEDFSVPLNMYNSCSGSMETDIDASMIAYYTSIFLKSGFDSEKNMLKVPGTTTTDGTYAQYYVDSEKFFEIILDTYYTEVN